MARKTNDKYRLQVTAGPEYDPASHFTVPVNQDETLEFENDHASVSICVRVRNFRGRRQADVPISGLATDNNVF
jgi:hypothetical protein